MNFKNNYLVRLNCIILVFVSFWASSCKNKTIDLPQDIKTAVAQSKDNHEELEKLFYHYSQRKEDSLKLKAAYFLVKNIVGYSSLDSIPFEQNKVYFDALELLSLSKDKRRRPLYSEIQAVLDSVSLKNNLNKHNPNIIYKYDIENISASFLIDNIDQAFAQWAKVSWTKYFTFEEFLQNVLPYRCSNTYMNSMRSTFISKYQKLIDTSLTNKEDSYAATQIVIREIDSTYNIRPSLFKDHSYLRPMKFSDIAKGKIGTCFDVVSLKVNILRSLGVPVGFDHIPCWGNSNDRHFFVKEIDNKFSSKHLCTNDQETQFGKIFDFDRKFDIAHVFYRNDTLTHLDDLPKGLVVNNIRTIPKVFRICFDKQSGSLESIREPNDDIPVYFKNDRLKDVTEEYVVNSDVSLILNSAVPNQKYAYLCCFDNSTWTVASWERIKNRNKITFPKMGQNVVYLPTYYSNGIMIPAGEPFLITKQGTIRRFSTISQNTQNLALLMKFPFRSSELRYPILKSWFSIANKADFSDATIIHKITKLPFYYTEVALKQPVKARYLLFNFPMDPGVIKLDHLVDATIAKLEFWGRDRNGQKVILKGTPIGNPGVYGHKLAHAFDENTLSFFQNDTESEPYIGIDLGSKNEAYLEKIVYCTKNDDNAIVSGDPYELFMWYNGSWKSLGINKGTNKMVNFSNVPINALLLLKGKGKEHRIFSYENGKQIFW